MNDIYMRECAWEGCANCFPTSSVGSYCGAQHVLVIGIPPATNEFIERARVLRRDNSTAFLAVTPGSYLDDENLTKSAAIVFVTDPSGNLYGYGTLVRRFQWKTLVLSTTGDIVISTCPSIRVERDFPLALKRLDTFLREVACDSDANINA